MSDRALNRSYLERQLLLDRVPMPTGRALEHLVGLQAQTPLSPYVSLWSRLRDFEPDELGRMLTKRSAVRTTLMRSTIHLVTARDSLTIRALVQDQLTKRFTGGRFAKVVPDVDVDQLIRDARALLDEQPRTRVEIGRALGERWPAYEAPSLGFAIGYLLPMVQVPPRGVWGSSGPAAWAATETWLGKPLDAKASIDRLVTRYLAAFGPASVADAQMWSGMTGLREVFERLDLVTVQSDGRTLFDLPDAPSPDPDTPAPVRFFPDFDNALLGHRDRRRIIPEGLDFDPIGTPSVLVDGWIRASWKVERHGKKRSLVVSHGGRLPARDEAEVADEAARLLTFLHGDSEDHDVRIESR